MKNLIKLSIVSVLLVGCTTTLPRIKTNIPLNTQIAEHGRNGAISHSVVADSLTKEDFQYLKYENFLVTTNFYKSGGEVIKFIEIHW